MRLEISIVRKHYRSSVTKVTLLIWKWEFHFRLVWKKRQERSEYIWKFCPSRIRIIPEIWARRLRVSAPAPGEATLVKKSPRLNYECCPALAVKHPNTKLLLKEILDEENVRDEGWQLADGDCAGLNLAAIRRTANQQLFRARLREHWRPISIIASGPRGSLWGLWMYDGAGNKMSNISI